MTNKFVSVSQCLHIALSPLRPLRNAWIVPLGGYIIHEIINNLNFFLAEEDEWKKLMNFFCP